MTRRGPGLPRRGVSLVELMAAMTAASVVMATSVTLVHRSFTFASRSRQVLSDERTATQLARQFRADVHLGRAVTCPAAVELSAVADPPLVVIELPQGRVAYHASGLSLVRTITSATGATGREDYRFSRPVAWTAFREGRLVIMRGVPEGMSPRLPPLAVDLAAAIPAELVASGGEP